MPGSMETLYLLKGLGVERASVSMARDAEDVARAQEKVRLCLEKRRALLADHALQMLRAREGGSGFRLLLAHSRMDRIHGEARELETEEKSAEDQIQKARDRLQTSTLDFARAEGEFRAVSELLLERARQGERQKENAEEEENIEHWNAIAVSGKRTGCMEIMNTMSSKELVSSSLSANKGQERLAFCWHANC
jgi:hypothetical protein